MNEIAQSGPTERRTDRPGGTERVLAALAHLAMLLSIPGLLFAVVVWLTQRHRSHWVAMQARRAVLWQIISNVLIVIVIIGLLGTALAQLFGAVNARHAAAQGHLLGAFSSLAGVYVVVVGAIVLLWLSAIGGAISALFGRGTVRIRNDQTPTGT